MCFDYENNTQKLKCSQISKENPVNLSFVKHNFKSFSLCLFLTHVTTVGARRCKENHSGLSTYTILAKNCAVSLTVIVANN